MNLVKKRWIVYRISADKKLRGDRVVIGRFRLRYKAQRFANLRNRNHSILLEHYPRAEPIIVYGVERDW